MTGKSRRGAGYQPATVTPIKALPVPLQPTANPTGPRTWELVDTSRPLPMNAYRRLHFRQRADYDRTYRAVFQVLARQAHIPHLDQVSITIAQACRRPPLPDVGASFPTAKAAIDGLVDAGVLTDDDPAHVRFLGFAAPERGPQDLFILIVEELNPTHPEGDTTP